MKSLRSIIVVLVSMLPLSTYAQSKEVEYNARRAATIQAMDSVLKYARMDTETLMKYADDKCKAFKNDTLVFVEVKTLPNGTVDMIQRELNYQKRQRIIKTSKRFLLNHRQYSNSYVRYDVIVIDMPGFERVYHIENAFSE